MTRQLSAGSWLPIGLWLCLIFSDQSAVHVVLWGGSLDYTTNASDMYVWTATVKTASGRPPQLSRNDSITPDSWHSELAWVHVVYQSHYGATDGCNCVSQQARLGV